MKKYIFATSRPGMPTLMCEKSEDQLTQADKDLLLGDALRKVEDLPSELKGKISDGYHTFSELYEHRCRLFIALLRVIDRQSLQRNIPWKAKAHSDGTMYEGWFIAGFNDKPGKMITYHLPIFMWDELDIERVFERAPEWDGHTSADVLERLKTL